MGLFDRQKLFNGEKLTDLFSEGETFALLDMAVVVEGSTEMLEGSTVDKTELIVLKDGKPVLASTLSGPIKTLASQNVRDSKGKPKADDLPANVSWKRVDTKNSYDNQATVLTFHSPYTGDIPKELPAFSFTPITVEDNPL